MDKHELHLRHGPPPAGQKRLDYESARVVKVHPSLPVFRIDPSDADRTLLYVPGKLLVISRRQADRYVATLQGSAADPSVEPHAAWLLEQAAAAVAEWQRQIDEPFAPECLTVYLSNQCNAACTYCYASRAGERDAGRAADVVSPQAVTAAARVVAASCQRQGRPFSLVVHGGGEPTVHWDLMEEVHARSREVAREHGLAWQGYIATNGMLPEEKAQRLGSLFGKVGLSCDGPPDLQDAQRPWADGSPSSAWVERSARAIKAAGALLTVRATVTPRSLGRQLEVVRYAREILGADEIRLEPVYSLPDAAIAGFSVEDARPLALGFAEAEAWGDAHDVEVSCSGVRLHEVHGPFCDGLRHVLHLVPGDVATGCFFSVGQTDRRQAEPVLGFYDRDADRFVLDQARVAAARQAAARIPADCAACINVYHCARGCPARCLVRGTQERGAVDVSCAFAQEVTLAWLGCALAPKARTESADDPALQRLAAILAAAPAAIDRDAICAAFTLLPAGSGLLGRRLPPPPWARHGFELDGLACREVLAAELDGGRGPLSVYVHVPFCDRHCGFCDCRSHRLHPGDDASQDTLVAGMLSQLATWNLGGRLKRRPVTTVHLGGGTPGVLAPDRFARLVAGMHEHLGVGGETEWAIETTGSLLGPEHLRRLADLGFRRLHVGVQTLEPAVRRRIGRRLSPAEILDRLGAALAAGFVTSVDLVLGLPGETLAGFAATVEALAAAGSHGFSLYVLNRSARNAKFLAKAPALPDVLANYAFFQAGDQLLGRLGYAKNHFTHYARPEDGNLYFRHCLRGEDLVALGPTADGAFGPWRYQNLDWPEWAAHLGAQDGIAGGLRETVAEARGRHVTAALMCGSVREADLLVVGAETLLAEWLDQGLVRPAGAPDDYGLTGNGSWLVREMLEAVERSAERVECRTHAP